MDAQLQSPPRVFLRAPKWRLMKQAGLSHTSVLTMRKSALTVLLCLMFCAPFVLLSVSYGATPSELPVLRVWIGHTALVASKSLFMVFRVPVMNLISGLMAAVMLSRASVFENIERRTSYSNMFSTVLFTAALKSDFEGLEFYATVSPALQPYQSWIGFGTLLCVVIGLGLAIIRGRKAPIPWPEMQLTMRDKILLPGLFALYVAIVIASLSGAHRA